MKVLYLSRLSFFLVLLLFPLFVPAQDRKLTAAEKKIMLANLAKIIPHVPTDFKGLQIGQFQSEMSGKVEGLKSKIVLFPAENKPYLDWYNMVIQKRRYRWEAITFEYLEFLPVLPEEAIKAIEPFLRSRKFEEVKPKAEYASTDFTIRAFRTKTEVIEVGRDKRNGYDFISISKKAEYYEPNVVVVEGFLPKGAVPEITISFEEQKEIASNLAKVLADAPNKFRSLVTGENKNKKLSVESESYDAAVDLFPIGKTTRKLPEISYKDAQKNEAYYSSRSPYSFEKLAPLMADLLLGMSYDEVEPLEVVKLPSRKRVFRGPQAIVVLNYQLDSYYNFFAVVIQQNAAYYEPGVVLITPGKFSPSSPGVPLNLNNPVSIYPFIEKKYPKGAQIDGKLIAGDYYNGNIYSYTDYYKMPPSRFTGIYQSTKEYWNVEEVKGTAYWDYLNVSFTGEFMPYNVINSNLWAKGYLKQGSDSTFGYLYHKYGEPPIWFTPQDPNKSEIKFTYTPSGKPYLENVRERAAADAAAWAVAEARLKRLPEGYFRSDYNGPAYDGDGNRVTTNSGNSSSSSSKKYNDNTCSACKGKGFIEKDCSACNNTRMIGGTVYDQITVSGPYGRTNVTYNVGGSGRTQSTYCTKCMGVCISYPDVQKAYARLSSTCSICKGTGKQPK